MIADHIVVHHSLTEDGRTVSWDAIRRYHMSKNWVDIGYHFGVELINDFHEILVGRMMTDTGAHCIESGMNSRSIGICVVGNFDIADPHPDAIDRLVDLVQTLQTTLRIPIVNVKRHTDFATYKSCPGARFPWNAFMARLEG